MLWKLITHEPALPDDNIQVAQAEHMRYPDNHFDLVVSTLGPFTYYNWAGGRIDCRRQLLEQFMRVAAPGAKIYVASNNPGLDKEERETAPLEDFKNRNPTALVKRTITDDFSRIRITKPAEPI